VLLLLLFQSLLFLQGQFVNDNPLIVLSRIFSSLSISKGIGAFVIHYHYVEIAS
jgi:hypothetical protein